MEAFINATGFKAFANGIHPWFGLSGDGSAFGELLKLAADGDHATLLRTLKEIEDKSILNQTEESGRSLLHHIYTAYKVSSIGNTCVPPELQDAPKVVTAQDVVQYLIQQGADVNLVSTEIRHSELFSTGPHQLFLSILHHCL